MEQHSLRCIRRKTRILDDLERFDGNVSRLCGHYGISRDTFYRWKKQREANGNIALVDSKPCHKIQSFARLNLSKTKLFIFEKRIILVHSASLGI